MSMSDCSTHAFEYPGIMRLDRIVFDDGSIRQVDYPFTAVNKAVAKVIVDGESYEPTAKMIELARANGELQARVHELESELAFTTCKCGEDIECEGSDTAVCPSCGRVVVR